MSKKYVIDLPDDAQYILINGASENHCYTRVEQVDDLEELNSDYINEHYGELQDEAYERGYEDGKNIIDNGCEGCKYTVRFADDEPCKSCSNCYKNKYEPMPQEDDRIEVGDEVEDSDGDKTIVTNIHGNLFDGLCSDGSVMSDLFLDDNHKTGKHYDIASILEAMRK
jgi:hypothetical protein